MKFKGHEPYSPLFFTVFHEEILFKRVSPHNAHILTFSRLPDFRANNSLMFLPLKESDRDSNANPNAQSALLIGLMITMDRSVSSAPNCLAIAAWQFNY